MIAKIARVAGRVLPLLAILYALLVGLGLLLTKVIENSWPIRDEDAVNRALAADRTPEMNDVTYVLSGLGNTIAIIGAMIVVAIALRLASKRWDLSVFLVLAVSAQAVVFLLVTLTIDRRRPSVRRLDASPPTSSFPSGHTGAATALFFASALLVLWFVRRRWLKILGITLLVAVPFLVAYGRLYRGMHHPSDIVGSYINGVTCIVIAATSIFGRGGREAEHREERELAAG
ncbi:MAG: phosphatase PAP2 family protein [Sporichthyaceae bacterium]